MLSYIALDGHPLFEPKGSEILTSNIGARKPKVADDIEVPSPDTIEDVQRAVKPEVEDGAI